MWLTDWMFNIKKEQKTKEEEVDRSVTARNLMMILAQKKAAKYPLYIIYIQECCTILRNSVCVCVSVYVKKPLRVYS